MRFCTPRAIRNDATTAKEKSCTRVRQARSPRAYAGYLSEQFVLRVVASGPVPWHTLKVLPGHWAVLGHAQPLLGSRRVRPDATQTGLGWASSVHGDQACRMARLILLCQIASALRAHHPRPFTPLPCLVALGRFLLHLALLRPAAICCGPGHGQLSRAPLPGRPGRHAAGTHLRGSTRRKGHAAHRRARAHAPHVGNARRPGSTRLEPGRRSGMSRHPAARTRRLRGHEFVQGRCLRAPNGAGHLPRLGHADRPHPAGVPRRERVDKHPGGGCVSCVLPRFSSDPVTPNTQLFAKRFV